PPESLRASARRSGEAEAARRTWRKRGEKTRASCRPRSERLRPRSGSSSAHPRKSLAERGFTKPSYNRQPSETVGMKRYACLALLLFACTAAVPAAVRTILRGGKTVIYNDGVGESAHAALAESDAVL